MRKKAFLIAACLMTGIAIAQREVQTINTNWKFHKGAIQTAAELASVSGWESVSIPHDWNTADAIDDEPGYYRGMGVYRKALVFTEADKMKKIYLHFEGVNQDAEVFLNNSKAGEHHGGYTEFDVDITAYILWNAENTLTVKVSNAEDPNWLPLSGDLCHFGGIYRDVYLIKAHPLHFDMNNNGSTGIFIRTAGVKEGKPVVSIAGAIENDNKTAGKVTVEHTITDASGKIVTTVTQRLSAKPGVKTPVTGQTGVLAGVKLWSPEEPTMYYVVSRILDEKNAILDEVRNPLGFRYYSMDKDKGFFLNGKNCFIKGIGRQQDYYKTGFAVSNEIQIEDVRMIRDMGCNFLRAHYPQDPVVWSECDRLGVMITGRIPLFDEIAYTKEFTENTKQMMKEMILQHFNNPSVVMWEYYNEMFGGMDWYWPKPQDPAKMKREMEEMYRLGAELEKYTRELDPERLTEQVFHTDPNPIWYKDAGLTSLCKANGWNIYFGWYHGNLGLVGKAIDEFRTYNTEVPYLIAEFGAGSDTRIHTEDPTVFDFSIEYQDRFQKVYLQEVAKRPWVAGMCMWTWCDFQVDHRGDVMPHINNKGMVTSDRKKKDSYYLYKSRWNPEPMIHIAGSDWNERMEITGGEKTISKNVTVYTNLKEVEMLHNGVPVGKKTVTDYEAVFEVPFREGTNLLVARGTDSDIRDAAEIRYRFQPRQIGAGFTELCVNVGQSRTYFFDPVNKDQWLPDRGYEKGGWGHVNGNYYRIWNDMKAWQGIREGVDRNIKGTEIDPVFQTFLVGITDYRFDVPDGDYTVELYFTEPFSRERRLKKEEQTGADASGERVFDVSVNGRLMVRGLNLAEQYGEMQAVKESFDAKAVKSSGIAVHLTPVKGEPVLSGIRVRKK